jgi:DNA-binding transcriptional MerR regulator
MDLMAIGAFAERTRLSQKALRLYDRLGLLVPARVDAATGYRYYREDQVESARLVALLRRLDMPLPVIADVLASPARDRVAALDRYWASVESVMAGRSAVVSYLRSSLTGAAVISYDIQTRSLPRRELAAISRHVHVAGTDAFFADAFARLRSSGPGLPGIAGCPFVVFYGEVSEDSDGPIELCRPVDARSQPCDGVEFRVEAAHDEAYIRLAARDLAWPAMAPAADALEQWLREHGRPPAGPLRQVMFADQRTASPEDLVCDLSVPLR